MEGQGAVREVHKAEDRMGLGVKSGLNANLSKENCSLSLTLHVHGLLLPYHFLPRSRQEGAQAPAALFLLELLSSQHPLKLVFTCPLGFESLTVQ